MKSSMEKSSYFAAQQQAGWCKRKGHKEAKLLNLKTSSLYRFPRSIDNHSILHDGGRIRHDNIPYDLNYSDILLKKSQSLISFSNTFIIELSTKVEKWY